MHRAPMSTNAEPPVKPAGPLLSVAVYTYNQERLVTETLDSLLDGGAIERERGGVELVVSDDCSTDGTVHAARSWMERRGSAFRSCSLLTGEGNVGPVRNYTRAVRACTGEIVKPLAGDDLFCPQGLIEAVREMAGTPGATLAFGRIAPFRDGEEAVPTGWTDEQTRFFAEDATGQFRILASSDPLAAPGVLFRRDLFEELRLWEYGFFWMEDWPLWLLATAAGHRIAGLGPTVARYRIHAGSTSQRMNAPGRERVRRGMNADRRLMYDRIVLPRSAELPPALRHHVRLRRFFFAWLERTRHPALVHWARELSLFADPYRIGRKLKGLLNRDD